MVLFETKHLIIRELLESDLEEFHDLHSNKHVMQPIPAPTMDVNECVASIKKLITGYSDPKNELLVYAIVLKSKSEFVGTCAIVKINEQVNEIGYRIREQFWRQGIGTEVAKHLITYQFNKTNVTEIRADVDSKNSGSIKILDTYMTRIKEVYDEKTQLGDIYYSLKKEDWMKTKKFPQQ